MDVAIETMFHSSVYM